MPRMLNLKKEPVKRMTFKIQPRRVRNAVKFNMELSGYCQMNMSAVCSHHLAVPLGTHCMQSGVAR